MSFFFCAAAVLAIDRVSIATAFSVNDELALMRLCLIELASVFLRTPTLCQDEWNGMTRRRADWPLLE